MNSQRMLTSQAPEEANVQTVFVSKAQAMACAKASLDVCGLSELSSHGVFMSKGISAAVTAVTLRRGYTTLAPTPLPSLAPQSPLG